MVNTLLVMAGGAIGAALRYKFGRMIFRLLGPNPPLGWPWGTLGVVVDQVDPSGLVASALKPGEVIVSANLTDVWEPRHLTRQIEDARNAGRQTILVLVRSPAGYRYSVLPVK